MLIPFIPKSPRFLIIPSLSFPPPYLKWVSTSTATKSPTQPPQNPVDHPHIVFNGGIGRSQFDYELSLVSALKSCSSLSAIFQGQQLHSLVIKSGFNSNTFIRNSLMNMYSKCGYLADAHMLFYSSSKLDSISCNILLAAYMKFSQLSNARQLFDIMPSRGCVSYTTMVMGYAQSGCWSEAIEVFKSMRSAGVVPNEVTMASVISACSHLGGIWNCLMLHALATKLQLMGLVLISTNMLHFYCVSSRLEDARYLFREMPERNIVSWNVMLNGYVKSGHIDEARELFEKIPEKDVVSWGTMIDGYVQLKWLSEALSMYRSMRRLTGLGPNEVMIVDLVSACGQSMAITEGQQLHGTILKAGFDCYDFIQATIISFYAGCGRIDHAFSQFQVSIKEHLASWNALLAGFIRNGMINQASEMFNEMIERDVFSWSTMISGCTQNEQPNLALQLFHRMVASGFQPNEITMVSVFSAIAKLGEFVEGRWAHQYICNNAIPLNDNLSAALIDMYAKCGSINSALDIFNQIRNKALSVSPWNAIICGLAMHGNEKLALKIFSDLQGRSIEPNSITFVGVLSSCCHAGLVEDGERYFEVMKRVYRIEPNVKHYGCMVDLLGRAGRLKEAEEMIRRMPMKADVVIWGTLLAACRTHGNVEIGERAAEGLARIEPSHGGGRVLLSNIYANAGLWEDAFLVRRAMLSLGMKRSPGYSGVV